MNKKKMETKTETKKEERKRRTRRRRRARRGRKKIHFREKNHLFEIIYGIRSSV